VVAWEEGYLDGPPLELNLTGDANMAMSRGRLRNATADISAR